MHQLERPHAIEDLLGYCGFLYLAHVIYEILVVHCMSLHFLSFLYKFMFRRTFSLCLSDYKTHESQIEPASIIKQGGLVYQ